MMKHVKKLMLMVLIGAQYAVLAQTIEINGLVSNARTGNPVPGHLVYFFVPATLDSLFIQTDADGAFSVSIALPEIDSSGVDVITYDSCALTTLYQRVNGWEANPFVHFAICADSVPVNACQAIFGYSEVGRDSVVNPDSSDWQSKTIWFYDYSTGNPEQWTWNFGDGTASSEQNPVHQYADTGAYEVTLAISGQDCNSSTSAMVYIGRHPYDTVPNVECMASFGYYAGTVADSIDYDTAGVYSENTVRFFDFSWGYPTEWSWDFGDGSTSNIQNPVHEFAGPGSYWVNLSIVSPDCQSSYAALVFVGIEPVDTVLINDFIAMFYPVIGQDNSVTFINQSVGSFTSYKWEFGDGSASEEPNTTHTYFEPGDYLVTLKGLYLDSLAATFEMLVGVGTPGYDSLPNAYFIPLFNETEVTFLEIAPNSVVERNWDFGDGNSSSIQNPTNEYNQMGIYTVTLDAKGFNSAETSFSMEINLSNKTYSGFFNSESAIIDKNHEQNGLNAEMYPVPVGNTSKLKFTSAGQEKVYIRICDLTGKVIYTMQHQANAGVNEIELNTGNFVDGMYLLTIQNNSQSYSLLFSK